MKTKCYYEDQNNESVSVIDQHGESRKGCYKRVKNYKRNVWNGEKRQVRQEGEVTGRTSKKVHN